MVRKPEGPGLSVSVSKKRYVVQERLAAGGSGVVYRVLDTNTGEIRALKRLNAHGARERATLEAFEREYHVLAGLEHPRIIRVFDYGIDDEGPYYTMEFVDGADIRSSTSVPYRIACFYLRDVATSLALLHARRLLHRDVSPRNVRATADGHCKLLDFGALANFGRTSVVVGTPPAIPPETLEGIPLDQRSDLFSLGALAYWMLTGVHAFPARELEELPIVWTVPPRPPSVYAPDVPKELDTLVLSLLNRDPRARPGSAAEVIARLNVIGELAAEDTSDSERLAESFLLQPRFTGRANEMRGLEKHLEDALAGRGAAVCIRAMHGLGRTRLLEEIGVRAQLAGATVVRVDASMHRQLHGSTRVLALKLLDALPDLIRDLPARFHPSLIALGPEVETRLGNPPVASARRSVPSSPPAGTAGSLEGFFVHVSHSVPIVVEIDNVEEADRGSLGTLATLAKLAPNGHVLLLATESRARAGVESLGLNALHTHSSSIELEGFTETETFELVGSLFADAPNAERLADWLHERTAGSPLHALEICRQLVAKRVIQYSGGVWTLPVHRPDANLSPALEEVLSIRIESLGESARSLAECLSLQREQPTFDLCRRLSEPLDERQVILLLDELARNDVLHREADGYRFSSTAIRDALLRSMDEAHEEQSHRRLGEAFAALAGEDDLALRIQAGFHLIRGGRSSEGADLIASVARDSAAIRTLMANLHRVGEPLEAALLVYRRERRTPYERMPILAALAQAGYYEERIWGERYGDEALSVLEDLSGIDTARRLRRFCGRLLGLVLGILFALLRYRITPRRERPYSFVEVVSCLLSTVTTLAGTASLSLDPARAARVADTLEPFSVLPERLTPVGIYQFCRALQEIGRENEAVAFERFGTLRRRFEDHRYYPTLPDEARVLYIAAARFSQATMGMFRADGGGVLECADGLDGMGLRLYTMIASQLRYLYRMNRGEFAEAEEQRKLVELHAAQVGSIWQVETWESPALILVYTSLADIVSATRVVHRLELLSREVPALRPFYRLSISALERARGDSANMVLDAEEFGAHTPRSYIGWAPTLGYLAQAYNDLERYEDAKDVAERTLAHVTDADRDFPSLFLNLEIQQALAIAGLGRPDGGLAILDRLLARFQSTDHPLVLGFLHEARARICWAAGRTEEYEKSVAATEAFFRGTGTPILIARCEQLGRLRIACTVSSVPLVREELDAPTVSAPLLGDTKRAADSIRPV
ncbi:MAG TPA: protein kinase [Polyangiaceae bacterium]|nr:protein kinase [Polyangiaceae bacterium]